MQSVGFGKEEKEMEVLGFIIGFGGVWAIIIAFFIGITNFFD